jgi:hypothetical protein
MADRGRWAPGKQAGNRPSAIRQLILIWQVGLAHARWNAKRFEVGSARLTFFGAPASSDMPVPAALATKREGKKRKKRKKRRPKNRAQTATSSSWHRNGLGLVDDTSVPIARGVLGMHFFEKEALKPVRWAVLSGGPVATARCMRARKPTPLFATCSRGTSSNVPCLMCHVFLPFYVHLSFLFFPLFHQDALKALAGGSQMYEQKCLPIMLARLSADHPDVATIFYNLASVYHDMGEHRRAGTL